MSKTCELNQEEVFRIYEKLRELSAASQILKRELEKGGFSGVIETDGGKNHHVTIRTLEKWCILAANEIGKLPSQKRTKSPLDAESKHTRK